MFKLRSQQNGSIIIWMVLVVVVAVWGMYMLAQSNSVDTETETTSVDESTDAKPESITITKSLMSVNDYSTSRGKVVIEEDKFRNFSLSIAASIPSEFPGTNYFAKLTGSGSGSDVEIGQLSKSGGSYVASYNSSKPISDYFQVVIYVDGQAATVEGKTLPHNVMELTLND